MNNLSFSQALSLSEDTLRKMLESATLLLKGLRKRSIDSPALEKTEEYQSRYSIFLFIRNLIDLQRILLRKKVLYSNYLQNHNIDPALHMDSQTNFRHETEQLATLIQSDCFFMAHVRESAHLLLYDLKNYYKEKVFLSSLTMKSAPSVPPWLGEKNKSSSFRQRKKKIIKREERSER
ncbi:hypothetical protein [Aneurinibacillus uraniidurans]|uniref:hypothetical protein n=1 Tax=Aneurinibacillus uraniidurans TaxID=2966586 RepID=UPI00234944B6|nr:hypothetical protein [Aneurinibacillus sp. B1]WCN37467.1 hypothetical protein PO771_16930 [Aneurinibacillus sp. B1]